MTLDPSPQPCLALFPDQQRFASRRHCYSASSCSPSLEIMNDDSDTPSDEAAEHLEHQFDLFVRDHVQLHERMRDLVARISESKNNIDAVIKRGLEDVRLGVGYVS